MNENSIDTTAENTTPVEPTPQGAVPVAQPSPEQPAPAQPSGEAVIEEPLSFSGGTEPEKPKQEKKAKKQKKPEKTKKDEKVSITIASNAFELVSVFVSALVVIAVVFVFIARPVGVRGTSMLPTLNSGDWLLVSPLYDEPEYGDIIVSYPPSAFDEPLIKRVIAVGGQKVDIDYETGIVYVDDVALDESFYVNTPTTRQTEYDQQFPLYVPYGYVFMCGDNRNGSTDSRSTLVGFCREEYILGKAIGRIVPFGQWDIYESFRRAVGEE